MSIKKGIPSLRRAIVDLIYRSKSIMALCPPGHDVIVEVSYFFRPISPTVSVVVEDKRRAVRTDGADATSERKVRLIPAGTPFLEEHFEALLDLPLGRHLRKFVEFFLKRKNRPTTPEQWLAVGFTKKDELAAINHLCAVHGLWIRLWITTPGKIWPKNGFQFVVMQEAPTAQKEKTPLPRLDLID